MEPTADATIDALRSTHDELAELVRPPQRRAAAGRLRGIRVPVAHAGVTGNVTLDQLRRMFSGY